MKITKKDLQEWVMQNTPIKYRGNIYKAFYNGREYFLFDANTDTKISLYSKGKGIFGLTTNK